MSAGTEANRLSQMAKLVVSFLNRLDTLAFREPVDPRAMNIPDYFQVVKNPMDLGTVKSKLDLGRYERAEDVAKDIRLIWSNCILYNSADSDFGVLASTLAKRFEERYAKIVDKEREKKVKVRADPVDARAPSLEEKVRFTYNLYKVSREEVGQAMEQVDARCPQALKSPAEAEVELNVDMMDPVTFRVVERLINEALYEVNMPAAGGGGVVVSASGKSKSGSGGGSSSSKKRKGADGDSRSKKQRT